MQKKTKETKNNFEFQPKLPNFVLKSKTFGTICLNKSIEFEVTSGTKPIINAILTPKLDFEEVSVRSSSGIICKTVVPIIYKQFEHRIQLNARLSPTFSTTCL